MAFIIHELGTEMIKNNNPELFIKNMTTVGLLKMQTMFERLPYIIYDFLGI